MTDVLEKKIGYMKNDVAVISNAGDRMINEDCIRIEENDDEFFVALADGLGGHGKGDLASALVTNLSINIFNSRMHSTGEQLLNTIFGECQKKLILEQQRINAINAMKTTLVLCYVTKGMISWGHIGDSRLYLFERGEIVARTYDHSVPQMLVYAKKIREKDIRFHEDRNRLLKVLGTEWDKPEFELHQSITRRKSQALLLCSDGFWELVDEKKMQHCLKKAHCAQEWLHLMENVVMENGKDRDKDNYSAVGVWL